MTNAKRRPWYRLRNIGLAVLALIVCFLAWAGYWVYWALTVEANPSTDYAVQLEQLSRDVQPPGENGWPDIVRACEVFRQFEESFPPAERLPLHREHFQFEAIYREDYELIPAGWESEVTAEELMDEKLAALAWLDTHGAWSAIADAGTKPNIVWPVDAGGDPLYSVLLPEAGLMRRLSKARAATMALAIRRSDNAAAARALQDLLILSRANTAQATMIFGLVGNSIRETALSLIRQELMLGTVDAALAAALLEVLNENPPPADSVLQFHGEKIFFHDLAQRLFSDDGNGDGIMIVNEAESFIDDSMTVPGQQTNKTVARLSNLTGLFMASRKEVVTKADELYDQFIMLAKAETGPKRWDEMETSGAGLRDLGYRYALLAVLIPAVGRATEVHDIAIMNYDATRIMLAIELYRATHSAPPASLDDLVPDFLEEVPLDAATVKPFGYRVLDEDEHGRDYLLYSFGRDQTDNGGLQIRDQKPDRALKSKRGVGYDFVLNAPVIRAADATR